MRGLGKKPLIALASTAIVVGAGCFGAPPPPPLATQACGMSYSSASAYQNDFSNLTHGNTGWITADGYVPTPLPGGNTGWWMSDTTTGTVNPDNSAPNAGHVHNSLVVQDSNCLTPKLGGQAWAWTDLIPAPSGQWYWPGSTVVENDTLLVFAYIVGPGSGPAGFDFTIFGTAVLRYHLPDLSFQNATNLPFPQPPPTGTYGSDHIPWGIRSVDVGGTVYLYGMTKESSLGPADIWVARAPFASVGDSSTWEYFTNPALPALPAWSDQFALAKPMTFPDGSSDPLAAAPIAQLSVYQYGSKYLASAVNAVLDPQGRIRAWIADNPEGPWTYLGVVATAQFQNSNQIAYDARVTDLTGAGWTAVYNVNDPNPGDQAQNVTLYRGQFATPASGVLPPPSP